MNASETEAAKRQVRWRLAVMMVLVYGVQGAWWPLLAVHLRDLGISGRGRGWIFATWALASLVTPLYAGHLADRWIPAQWLLATIYAMGAGLLIVLATTTPTHAAVLCLLFLTYWLLLAPGYGLSNTVAFRNLPRPRDDFGKVRLWGTVGWMLAGFVVTAVMAQAGSTRTGKGAYEAFAVGAIVAGLCALYALSLPHTPPLAVGAPGRLNLRDSLELVRRPAVLAYLVGALGVSLTTPFVYQVIPAYLEAKGMPRAWTASAMSLGQVPEVLGLAVLPWMLSRWGYRGTLCLGIGAYAVRYGSLLVDPPLWVAVLGIPLHGIGIACFTVGGQVFLDSAAPTDRRASAQALNVVVMSGIGSLLGSLLAGETVNLARGETALVFVLPCLINTGLLLYFVQGFRPAKSAQGGTVATSVLCPARDAARAAVVTVSNLGAESADG